MYVNITKAVTNNHNLAKFPRTGAADNDIHYLWRSTQLGKLCTGCYVLSCFSICPLMSTIHRTLTLYTYSPNEYIGSSRGWTV